MSIKVAEVIGCNKMRYPATKKKIQQEGSKEREEICKEGELVSTEKPAKKGRKRNQLEEDKGGSRRGDRSFLPLLRQILDSGDYSREEFS